MAPLLLVPERKKMRVRELQPNSDSQQAHLSPGVCTHLSCSPPTSTTPGLGRRAQTSYATGLHLLAPCSLGRRMSPCTCSWDTSVWRCRLASRARLQPHRTGACDFAHTQDSGRRRLLFGMEILRPRSDQVSLDLVASSIRAQASKTQENQPPSCPVPLLGRPTHAFPMVSDAGANKVNVLCSRPRKTDLGDSQQTKAVRGRKGGVDPVLSEWARALGLKRQMPQTPSLGLSSAFKAMSQGGQDENPQKCTTLSPFRHCQVWLGRFSLNVSVPLFLTRKRTFLNIGVGFS